MIDNFAPVTCLIRGLFSPRGYADRLELMLNLPEDVEYYEQRDPIYFGEAKIFLRGKNGIGTPKAYLDSKETASADPEGHISIPAELLTPGEHEIYIGADGKGFVPPRGKFALPEAKAPLTENEEIAAIIEATRGIKGAETVYEMALAAALRRKTPFDKEFFRPMTDEKKQAIIKLCDEAAISAYEAFSQKA